jgi:hypothetical protein
VDGGRASVTARAVAATRLRARREPWDRGRPLRYPGTGIRWFELDHPATQADKRDRLPRLGIPTDDIAFVPADFRADPVAERLTAAGCDPADRARGFLRAVRRRGI